MLSKLRGWQCKFFNLRSAGVETCTLRSKACVRRRNLASDSRLELMGAQSTGSTEGPPSTAPLATYIPTTLWGRAPPRAFSCCAAKARRRSRRSSAPLAIPGGMQVTQAKRGTPRSQKPRQKPTKPNANVPWRLLEQENINGGQQGGHEATEPEEPTFALPC